MHVLGSSAMSDQSITQQRAACLCLEAICGAKKSNSQDDGQGKKKSTMGQACPTLYALGSQILHCLSASVHLAQRSVRGAACEEVGAPLHARREPQR